MMAPLDPFTSFVRDTVASLGFELVDCRVAGPAARRSVRLRIDRPGSQPGAGVTADDCALVARTLQGRAADEGWVEGLDHLEVSSPGIERPIRWPEHWRRFIGQRVRLRLPGRKGRPAATIVAVPDDLSVELRFDDGEAATLVLEQITDATLVVEWPRARER